MARRPAEAPAPARVPTRNYGLHLTLDGYGGNPEKLNDLTLIFNVLDRLPAKIDMTKVGFPHLIRYTEGEIAGISGFVFILESHISVHTYPKKAFLSMDTYSCKDFDPAAVVREFQAVFELAEIEQHVLVRGTRFPARNLFP